MYKLFVLSVKEKYFSNASLYLDATYPDLLALMRLRSLAVFRSTENIT